MCTRAGFGARQVRTVALRTPICIQSCTSMILSRWLVRRPVAHGGESDQCGEVPAVYKLYVREQRAEFERIDNAPFCLQETSQAEDFTQPQRPLDASDQ